jgi:hypothetical protein
MVDFAPPPPPSDVISQVTPLLVSVALVQVSLPAL